MKKIVMIGPSPLSHGGMASVISTLLRSGYSKSGKCIFIATQTDGNGLQKILIGTCALLKFSFLLLTGRIEALHAHVASGMSFWRKAAFIWLANLAGCPVIFHLHGGKFRSFIEKQPLWRQRISLNLIKRSAYCFTLTQEASKWLSDVAGAEHVEVFPNPIFLEQEHSRKQSLDVLFLGRIEEEKGIFDLLHAFTIVNNRLPAARLIIGGEGNTKTVVDLSRKLGILNSVILTGWLDEEARTDWLSRSAVFVLPSLYEQMPMTILEAMATGTPVVATRVGAVADMLEDGKCGSLVDPGKPVDLAEAIYSTLSNPASSTALSERALIRVKNIYSADQVIARLEDFYLRLAKGL